MLQLQLAAHSGAFGTSIRTAPQWHDPLTDIVATLPITALFAHPFAVYPRCLSTNDGRVP